MIDIALFYAGKGWPIFPLSPGSKLPAIPKTCGGHGVLDATCDAGVIAKWWDIYPQANIGIATGNVSRLLVIDVDPIKAADWLASLKALKLPTTFTVRTARGGWHLYFFLQDDTKVSIGTNLAPGIDWRCNSGYVVSPGSVVDGVTYQIVRDCPLASAPLALLARIATHGKGAHVAARDTTTGDMIIPNGTRNQQLFRIACALRRFGVDFNAIYTALSAVSTDHCDPPMPDEELRTIAASAMKYAPEPPV